MNNLSNQSTEHNPPEFLPGDMVVFTHQKYEDVLLEVVGFSSDPELLKVKRLKTALCGYVFIENLRHATVAEIKAKRRLAALVILFVSDIEMHYQRALESQKEVS
ncbi:hypothetical protein RMB03_17505 [Acinetobacter sp. V91_7]|uniref:hypothetical protein n=1 Tax=unclassified Acinetobacter TaxID=196816 RepID=UPI00287DBBAE|nr:MULTISPECIES: hypothetical protein [unclassified Acinetobacter]MDS7935646.1 hypothetical protein [Acinetobacter sp. V91_4B]MDS7964746.1 hypothetical protein [Acinetobacter sp. V91_7]MDS8025559.1 hypothetical protein [Acinetobacter sp. V91_13]